MRLIIIFLISFIGINLFGQDEPVTRPKTFRLEKSDSEGQFIISDVNREGRWNDDVIWNGSNLILMGDTVATLPVVTIPIVDTFSFDGTFVYLSFEGDNKPADTLNLSSLAGGGGGGTDNQNLSYGGLGSLSIETGNTVDLSDLLDNTDQQTLSLNGNSLGILNGNSVDLSLYLDNTDNQLLGYSGNGIITLEDGGFIDITDMYQSIDIFSINGSNQLGLSIENDGQTTQTVDLSPYLDNTDDQIIDEFSFNEVSKVLSLSIEDDGVGSLNVDLSSLDDSGNAVVDGNGIYSGNGSTPPTLVNVNNSAGIQFQDVNDTTNTISIYNDENNPLLIESFSLVEYIEFGGAAASLGPMYIGKTNGFVDLILTDDQLVIDGATLTLRSGSVGSSLFLSSTNSNLTVNTGVVDFSFNDFRSVANRTSILLEGYGEDGNGDGGDYSTLKSNSLAPKGYIDTLFAGSASTWIRDTLPLGNVSFSAEGNQYRTTGLDIWSVNGLVNEYFFLGKGQIDQSANTWTAQIGGSALLKLDWDLENGHIEVRDGIDYFTFEDYRIGGAKDGIRYRGFGEANFLTDSAGVDYSSLRYNSLVPKKWVVDYIDTLSSLSGGSGGSGGFSFSIPDSLPSGDITINSGNDLLYDLSGLGTWQVTTEDGVNIRAFTDNLRLEAVEIITNGQIYHYADFDFLPDKTILRRDSSNGAIRYIEQQCIDRFYSWELVPLGDMLSLVDPVGGYLVQPEEDNICIDKLRARIGGGTNATVEILVNGVSQGSVIATTAMTAVDLNVALNSGDYVSFNVSGSNGGANGLFGGIVTKCDCL